MRNYVIFNTNQILDDTSYGGAYESSGSASLTLKLPSPTLRGGGKITIINGNSSGTLTLSTLTGVFYGPNNNNSGASTFVLQPGASCEFISDGTNWKSYNGTGAALLSGNGYQKLPSGLILQWGEGGNPITTANYPDNVTVLFPISFITNVLQIVATIGGNAQGPYTVLISDIRDKFGFHATTQVNNNYSGGIGFKWIAVGY